MQIITKTNATGLFTAAWLSLAVIGHAQHSKTTDTSLDHLKINQVQVLGTHNSYALAVDSMLFVLSAATVEKLDKESKAKRKNLPKAQIEAHNEDHPHEVKMSESLAYSEPPFDVQLNAGVRSLEIDIFNDPKGGLFSQPAGYRYMLEKGVKNVAPFDTTGLGRPGFKVLHMADFQFRSNYNTLKLALQAIKTWSDKHPNHFPISIMIEAKDDGSPFFPNPTQVIPFDEKAFDELEKEVLSVLSRKKLITPDDVRGNFPTLREAVLAKNWPAVKASRGKFLLLLLPTRAGWRLGKNYPYAKGRPNLEKRLMFLQSTPEDSYATFFLVDNAIARKKDIQNRVKQGFLVRTRADLATYEAKVNDQSRAKAAFESGAQIISTDFFQPGNKYGTAYFVTLPGGGEARRSVVNADMK